MTEADLLPRMAEIIADARAIRKEWRMSHMIDGAPSGSIAEKPVTPQQRSVLAFLAFGPAHVAEASRGTGISDNTMDGIFDSLTRKGLIRTEIRMKGNTRCRVGIITDAGKEELGA